jgi:hypothetical protein
MPSQNKNFPLLMPIFTALFSVFGILYLDWGVFHIVYLFWFENLVRIIAYRFKVANVDYVTISGKNEKARDENGNLLMSLKSVFTTRLFMYFVYFVFIVIGLGLVMPSGRRK